MDTRCGFCHGTGTMIVIGGKSVPCIICKSVPIKKEIKKK